MKKMACITSIIFIVASMAFVVYAQKGKVSISESDLSDLKGKWVGTRTTATARTAKTDLEIFNDTLPLQGKFILYDVRIDSRMGGKRAGGHGETETYDFKNVRINEQGNLLWKAGNSEIELSLYKDEGKMELKGNYFLGKSKGTMSFTKE